MYLKAAITSVLNPLLHYSHVLNPIYLFEVGASSRILRATPVFMRLWEQNELNADRDPREASVWFEPATA